MFVLLTNLLMDSLIKLGLSEGLFPVLLGFFFYLGLVITFVILAITFRIKQKKTGKMQQNSLFFEEFFDLGNHVAPISFPDVRFNISYLILSIIITTIFIECEVRPFSKSFNFLEGFKLGLLEVYFICKIRSKTLKYISGIFVACYSTFRLADTNIWLHNGCFIGVFIAINILLGVVVKKIEGKRDCIILEKLTKSPFSIIKTKKKKGEIKYLPNARVFEKILKKMDITMFILDSNLDLVYHTTKIPPDDQSLFLNNIHVRLLNIKSLTQSESKSRVSLVIKLDEKETLRDAISLLNTQNDVNSYAFFEVLSSKDYSHVHVFSYYNKSRHFFALNFVSEKPNIDEFMENQSKVLSFVSHEFRTPLNCIIGMLQCLENNVSEAIYNQFIQPALSSGKYLLNMLQDILDMTQLRAGKFSLNIIDFDLSLLFQDIFTLFQVQSKIKQISLSFEISPKVPDVIRTDPNRLKQIIINLISNAFKYTQKGNIILTCHLIDNDPANDDTGILKFSVEDTGLGIKDCDKPRLLQAFGKVEDNKNKELNPQGVGLGLIISQSISKELAEDLDQIPENEKGLLFESEYLKGSVFSFIIENKKKKAEIELNKIAIAIHENKVEDDQICEETFTGPGSFVEKLKSENQGKRFISKTSCEYSPKCCENNEKPLRFITNDFTSCELSPQYTKNTYKKIGDEKPFSFRPKLIKIPTEIICQIDFSRTSKDFIGSHHSVLVQPKDTDSKFGLYEAMKDVSFSLSSSNSKKKSSSFSQQGGRNEKSSILNHLSISLSSKNSKKSFIELPKVEEIMSKMERFSDKIKQPSVLVVDDNAYNILALQFLLDSLNIKHDIASGGDEAIEKVKVRFETAENKESDHCQFYQIIFLDLEMPGKDGFETCKEIKRFLSAFGGEHRTQIIACSGYNDESTNQKIREFGFSSQIVKPIMKGTLMGVLSQFIKE